MFLPREYRIDIVGINYTGRDIEKFVLENARTRESSERYVSQSQNLIKQIVKKDFSVDLRCTKIRFSSMKLGFNSYVSVRGGTRYPLRMNPFLSMGIYFPNNVVQNKHEVVKIIGGLVEIYKIQKEIVDCIIFELFKELCQNISYEGCMLFINSLMKLTDRYSQFERDLEAFFTSNTVALAIYLLHLGGLEQRSAQHLVRDISDEQLEKLKIFLISASYLDEGAQINIQNGLQMLAMHSLYSTSMLAINYLNSKDELFLSQSTKKFLKSVVLDVDNLQFFTGHSNDFCASIEKLIESGKLRKNFLQFLLKKVIWMENRWKVNLVRIYNQKNQSKILYDYTGQRGLITEEYLPFYIKWIFQQDPQDAFRFISENVSYKQHDIAIKDAVVNGVCKNVTFSEKMPVDIYIETLSNEKYQEIIRETKISQTSDFQMLLFNVLNECLRKAFTTKKSILELEKLVQGFFDGYSQGTSENGKYTMSEFVDLFLPKFAQRKETAVSPIGSIALIEMFTRVYSSSPDLFYEKCPKIFVDVEKQRLDVTIGSWNEIFNKSSIKSIETHVKFMRPLVKHVFTNSSEQKLNFAIRTATRHLHELLYSEYYELLAQKKLASYTLYDYLIAMSETRKSSCERDVTIRIFEEYFELNESGDFLIKHKKSNESVRMNFLELPLLDELIDERSPRDWPTVLLNFIDKRDKEDNFCKLFSCILTHLGKEIYYVFNNICERVLTELEKNHEAGGLIIGGAGGHKKKNISKEVLDIQEEFISRKTKLLKIMDAFGYDGVKLLSTAKDNYQKFIQKLKITKQFVSYFGDEVRLRLDKEIREIENSLPNVPIKLLKLTPELESISNTIQAKYRMLNSDLFLFYSKKNIQHKDFCNRTDLLQSALEASVTDAWTLVIHKQPEISIKGYFDEDLPEITNYSQENIIWNNEFTNNREDTSVESTLEYLMWLSRKREFTFIKNIVNALNNLSNKIYKKNCHMFSVFEKNANDSFLSQKNLLSDIWDMIHPYDDITKRVLLYFGCMEEEIKLLRNTEEKVLNDVSELLRDPSQRALFGNRCTVSDISMVQALKERDDSLHHKKPAKDLNDIDFMKHLISVVVTFLKENEKFFNHAEKFHQPSEVDTLQLIFENVGNQTKLVSSTVKSILLPETHYQLHIQGHISYGELITNISIVADNSEQDRLEFQMRDLDEYYQILNIEENENKGSNTLFFEVYEDIKRIVDFLNDLFESGYDVMAEIEAFKKTPIVTPYGKSAVQSVRSKLQETYEIWHKQFEDFRLGYTFLDEITRGELPELIKTVEGRIDSPRIHHLVKMIDPKLSLSDLFSLADQMANQKTFASKVETVGSKLSQNLPALKLRSQKSLSQDESRMPSLTFWKVSYKEFVRAFLSVVFLEGGSMAKPKQIMVLGSKSPKSYVNCFFRKIQRGYGLFIIIIPKTQNTMPNSSLLKEFSHSLAKVSLSLNSSSRKVVVIHHEELTQNDLIENTYINVRYGEDADLLSDENIRIFFNEHDIQKKNTVKLYTSENSGEGKSYTIRKLVKSITDYYEITLGGHTDFSLWINRILDLLPRGEIKNEIILNIVVGLPETVEREEEIESFYAQVSVFLSFLILMRGYRSPQSYIELSDKINLQIEISNTPARLIKKHLELFEYMDEVSIKPFSFEAMKVNEELDQLEAQFKIQLSPDTNSLSGVQKAGSKILNLLYVFQLMQDKKLRNKRMQFPCPGANIMDDKTAKESLKKHFFQSVKDKEENFGKITYRNFLSTLNMVFLEFNDYNQATFETSQELNNEALIYNNDEKEQLFMSQETLFQEIINFCISYTSSSAGLFIMKQSQVLDPSIHDFMKELFDEKNVIRFEKLELCLIYFSKKKFHLLFKDAKNVNPKVRHSFIMQEFVEVSKKRKQMTVPQGGKPMGDAGQQSPNKKPEIELTPLDKNLLNYLKERKEGKATADVPELFEPLCEDQETLWKKLGQLLDLDSLKISEIRKNSQFVLTCDGLLKIVIIAKKLRARFPLILIGETGTGKTYLVKFMSSHILKYVFSNEAQKRYANLFYNTIHYHYQLIHAGVSEHDIITLIAEKERLALRTEARLELFLIFFDEFNTATSIDLISTILTKHTLFGKRLPNNMIFIGACNPFVIKEKTVNQAKDEEQSALVHPKGASKLTYSVNPLTEIEISYLMDFGQMTKQQELMYSEAIIKKCIVDTQHKNADGDDEVSKNFLSLIVNLVSFSQNFAKEYEGPSSMSIRDIKKFIRSYEWIRDVYLVHRKKDDQNKDKKDYDLELPLFISLWLVYYLRIVTNNRRAQYAVKIDEEYKRLTGKDFNLIQFITEEQMFLCDNLKIEDGISKNTPLCENILALFICFNTRIPILICGKPGCSKTLAINILNDNMQGFRSASPFMRVFPITILTFYQGSVSSRSEGVISAFENANRIAKSHEENHRSASHGNKFPSKYIVILVFDELGLAELSPYNPLKVLHGYLDEEGSPCGFAGISNWGLDAAKNNRAVFVARPDLTRDDLRKTARNISQTYSKSFADKYGVVWDHLADTYFDFTINQSKTLNRVFHGPRDFYSLIKSISLDIKSKIQEGLIIEGEINDDLGRIIKLKIYRNFGGLENSAHEFLTMFRTRTPIADSKKPSVYQVLGDYLTTQPLRYVMAIGEGGEYFALQKITESILTSFAENKTSFSAHNNALQRLAGGNKYDPNSVHVISGLDRNESPEELERRVTDDLNLIQGYLKKGDLIILNNYPQVYTSLYELFNMRRREINGKIFCEIAYSSKTNRHVEISESAKVIVLVNSSALKDEQAPFLNRFEKYILNFNDAMEENEVALAEELVKTFNKMYHDNIKCFIPMSRAFFNICPEFIKSIVIYQRAKNKKLDIHMLKTVVMRKIIRCFPSEFYFHLQIGCDEGLIDGALSDTILTYTKQYSQKYGNIMKVAEYLKGLKTTHRIVCFSSAWKDSRVGAFDNQKWVIKLNFDEFDKFASKNEDVTDKIVLIQVTNEKELRALNQVERIQKDGLRVLALVTLRRIQEEFDYSLLQACFETNGWKVLYLDSSEPNIPEMIEVIKEKDQDAANEKLSQRGSFLFELLMKNMLKIGVSLELDKSNSLINFRQRVSELELSLRFCIEDKLLSSWILDGIFENSCKIQKKGQMKKNQNEKKDAEDWRKHVLIDEKSNTSSDSIWEVAQVPLQHLVINDSIFKILRSLINNGVPQAMSKLQKCGDVTDEIVKDIYEIFVGNSKEKLMSNDAASANTSTKGNLHYPYYIPVVWTRIEEEYKKYEKVLTLSDDFIKLWKEKDNKDSMVENLKNKLFRYDTLFYPFSQLSNWECKRVVSDLLQRDVITFYEERYPEFLTREGKELVQYILENNPFDNKSNTPSASSSMSSEDNKHTSMFIVLFYSKDLLKDIIKLRQDLKFEYNSIIIPEKIVINAIFDKISSESLKYEPKRLINSYQCLKDLFRLTEVRMEDFRWNLVDLIIKSYETLLLEEDDQLTYEFDKRIIDVVHLLIKGKSSLTEMCRALLSLPLTRSVSIRKGITQIIKLSRKHTLEIDELNIIIYEFAFYELPRLQMMMNIIFDILSEYSDDIMSLTKIPRFMVSQQHYLTNKLDLQLVYRGLILKLFLENLKKEQKDSESSKVSSPSEGDPNDSGEDPLTILRLVYKKYTQSPEFWRFYFKQPQGPIKQIYIVIIRLHTLMLSSVLTLKATKAKYDELTMNELKSYIEFCFMTGPTTEEKEFYEFTQKVVVRKTIKNGSSLSALGSLVSTSNIKFELLKGNLKSQFFYELKPVNRASYDLIASKLRDSFFGAQTFYSLIKDYFSNPMTVWNVLQVYMSAFVVYNDDSEDRISLSVGNLTKAADTLNESFSPLQKFIIGNYIGNMKSMPKLSISSSFSPFQVLRNLSILTIINTLASYPKGLAKIFIDQEGNLKDPEELKKKFIPGTFNDKVKNYHYMLELNVQWRNYNQNYSNSTHLLLECEACGNLNPMFACNNPHQIVLCNPPKCQCPVDSEYVRKNHIDEIKVELPKRIDKLLAQQKGLQLFDVSSSKKTSTIGKLGLLGIKFLHILYWCFIYAASQYDERYMALAAALLDIQDKNPETISSAIIQMIDRYMNELPTDLGCPNTDQYFWLCGVTLEFLQRTHDSKIKLFFDTIEDRITFEEDLERLMTSSTANISESVQKYKDQFKNTDVTQEMVQIIEDSDRDKKSAFYQALNQEIELSEVALQNFQTEILDVRSQAQLTKMVYSQEEDYKKLQYLEPLINCYDKMIKRYRCLISKKESKNNTIKDYIELSKKDARWSSFPRDFSEFKAIWDKAKIHGLRLGCKELRFKSITEEDKIGFLLPCVLETTGATEQERRMGLYLPAALQTLAQMHNEIIKKSVDLYDYLAKGILDARYSVHLRHSEVNSTRVIKLENSFQEFISSYVKYNLEITTYKLKLKASCDFQMMDRDLMVHLIRGKRLILEDDKEFPVYVFQNSISNENTYLDFIDVAIPQTTMSEKIIEELECFLDKTAQKDKARIFKLLSELEQIIILLKETKKSEKASLKRFAENFENGEYISFSTILKHDIFAKMDMTNLKKCYDLCENRSLFLKVKDKSDDFKMYSEPIPEAKELEALLSKQNIQTLKDLFLMLGVSLNRSILTDIDRDKTFLHHELIYYIESFLEYVNDKDEKRFTELENLLNDEIIGKIEVRSSVTFYELTQNIIEQSSTIKMTKQI